MRRTLIIPTALLVSTLALAGCSAGMSGGMDGGESVPAREADYLATDSTVVDQSVGEQQVVDREVIVTGWMTVTVDKPLEAATEAVRIAESAGGRVDSRTEYAPVNGDQGSATLTLRIPADSLTATVDKLKELGSVQEVSLNSSDVTMVTQDLDARISALTASIERLTALLQTATDTDALISLETALSDRQGQLESLESERRYYSDQVAMSTVTLNLVSVADSPTQEPKTFVDGLVAGWNSFVAFFAGLIVVAGVLVPWLVLAGIITGVVLLLIRWRQRRHTPPTPPVE